MESSSKDQKKDRELIYTVFVKSDDINGVKNFNLLKRAFKTKYLACEYAVLKITAMLNEINTEYTNGEYSQQRILPIHSNLIYVMYNMKFDKIEKYEYFLSTYKKFFHCVSFPMTMFFVSEHYFD